MIRLLVGLGNPGSEYEHTRHNAGFWWIDAVARELKATLSVERSYFGLVARVNRPLPGIEGPLWLLEPLTYMNLSGKSVAALARFYKIAPDQILVAHDELDLMPGQMKLKQGGSQIWAQDEASCVIYGMPMAIVKANLADAVYPLDDIGRHLVEACL